MVSWRINSTKLSNKQKLNEMGKTSNKPQNKPCTIHGVVRSCYWCNVPITDKDEVEELPEGRGEAHKKCADEWYGCQMADD